jgi:hypothetical protein
MTENTRSQGSEMGKIQKSLMLHPHLCAILDAHQAATGVSFTRILTAAILQYFYADMNGPDPYWMKIATGIERGDLSVGDLTLRVLDDIIARLERTLANINEHFDSDEPEIYRLREHYEFQLHQYSEARDQWAHRIATASNSLTATTDALSKTPYRGMSLDIEWQLEALQENPPEKD